MNKCRTVVSWNIVYCNNTDQFKYYLCIYPYVLSFRISELLERLEEASGRNNDLADNTKHVSNGEGSAVLKDSDMVAQSRRHLDSLKLLADELAVTRNENRRLLREMEELHEAAKGEIAFFFETSETRLIFFTLNIIRVVSYLLGAGFA